MLLGMCNANDKSSCTWASMLLILHFLLMYCSVVLKMGATYLPSFVRELQEQRLHVALCCVSTCIFGIVAVVGCPILHNFVWYYQGLIRCMNAIRFLCVIKDEKAYHTTSRHLQIQPERKWARFLIGVAFTRNYASELAHRSLAHRQICWTCVYACCFHACKDTQSLAETLLLRT